MKLGQLLSSMEAFNRLIQNALPAKVSLNLNKLVRQINQEIEDYDKVRLEALERLGTKRDGDAPYDFAVEENKVEFIKQIESLLDSEVELKFYTIPISVLERNNIKILPMDLDTLDWLIVDDTKEQEPKDI